MLFVCRHYDGVTNNGTVLVRERVHKLHLERRCRDAVVNDGWRGLRNVRKGNVRGWKTWDITLIGQCMKYDLLEVYM